MYQDGGSRLRLNGKVAVIYSPGYGAGWSTWYPDYCPAMLFDASLARFLLADDQVQAKAHAEKYYPDAAFVVDQLKVMWVDEGDEFRIDVHDGYERVVVLGKPSNYVA